MKDLVCKGEGGVKTFLPAWLPKGEKKGKGSSLPFRPGKRGEEVPGKKRRCRSMTWLVPEGKGRTKTWDEFLLGAHGKGKERDTRE